MGKDLSKMTFQSVEMTLGQRSNTSITGSLIIVLDFIRG